MAAASIPLGASHGEAATEEEGSSSEHEPGESAEDQEADGNADANDDEERCQNADDEQPVASTRNGRAEPVVLNDLVVARVRLEPEREGIADDRDDADDFVRQDIARHPREKNFRNAKSKRLNQCKGRDEGRTSIADSRNQSEERVEAETKICSGNANDLIHDESKPFEERLKALAFPFFFRRKDLPIDFL
jgi:hypothetical protein